jgi:hypothetical protein
MWYKKRKCDSHTRKLPGDTGAATVPIALPLIPWNS